MGRDALGFSLPRAQKEVTFCDPAALRLIEGRFGEGFHPLHETVNFSLLNKHRTYNYQWMALKQKAHVECLLCSWHDCKPNGS